MNNHLVPLILVGSIIVIICCGTSRKTQSTNTQTEPTTTQPRKTSDTIGEQYPAARVALNLLRKHESLNGKLMIGDGGRAHGWLQQHKAHWQHGCDFIGVSWSWPKDTNTLWKCEEVALANWMKDARHYLNTGNVSELIRRFRLPFKPYRQDNTDYLEKVLEKNDG